MLALIDADILVFRAGFAAEKNQWFLSVGGKDPEVFSYKKDASARLDELLPGTHSREEGVDYQMWPERYLEPVENALQNVKTSIAKIMEALSVTEFDIECYLSGPTNYRYELAKTRPYKGNRDKSHRPFHEEAIKDYIKSKWNTITTDGIEADDALGIKQTASGRGNSVIVSIDKDLDMIPGMHYNFMHDVAYEVDPDMADKLFFGQLLTGDSTDNIPGLPGVGKAKANRLLDALSVAEARDEVVRQYASKSKKEDWLGYLNEQAALLWIQREPEVIYQFSENEDDLLKVDQTIQVEMY
jgi:hypothetical protein